MIMSKAAIGAKVMYCNHDGWFPADIHVIDRVNLIIALGPISATLERGRNGEATHHLFDGPGYWSPARGVFCVPVRYVETLRAVVPRDPLLKQKVKRWARRPRGDK
jgi:hypothetical protein